MAQPTISTFAYTDPSEFSIWVGTYTTGSTGLLNQIKSVSGRTTKARSKTPIKRIGDTAVTVIRGIPEYESTLSLGVFDEEDSGDYSALTGDGSSPFDLTTTANLTITIGHHVTAGGNLDYWWQCTGFEIEDIGFDIDADTTPTQNTINMTSESRWIRYNVA